MRPIRRRDLFKVAAAAGGGAALSSISIPTAFAAGPAIPPGNPVRGGTPNATIKPHAGPLTLSAPPGMHYTNISGVGNWWPYYPATSHWALGGAGGIYQSDGGLDVFLHQLNLPQGSVIDNVVWSVYVHDPYVVDFYVWRYDPSVPDGLEVAHGAWNVQSTSVQNLILDVPTTGGYSTVDNRSYNYYLCWWPGSVSANHILFGARVGSVLPGGVVTMLPAPIRVLDTRGESAGAQYNYGPAFANGTTRSYGPFNAIPAIATGIVANLTAVNWHGTAGYLTIFPTGANVPGTSSLNFSTSAYAWANGVTAGFGTGVNAGKVSIFASVPGGSVDVLLDIVGYTT